MKSKPEHYEDGHCRHCMGPVGEDGYAPLGEAEEFEPFEHAETDQHEAGEKMHDNAGFKDAVKRMAHGGYTDPPMVEAESFEDEMARKSHESDDMLDSMSGPGEMKSKALETGDELDSMTMSPEEMKQKTMIEMRRRKAEHYGFGRGKGK